VDREKLRERLLVTFLGELEEHARTLEANALALEKAPEDGRAELLATLFRAAHSLKGAARSAGVPLIEGACHRLEELLGGARDGWMPTGSGFVQTLLSAADALSDAARRMRAKEDLDAGPLRFVLEKLEGAKTSNVALQASGPGAASSGPPSASTPEGGDLALAMLKLPATKLDALVARSGELLVARQRASNRQDELLGLRDTLGRCLAEWPRFEKSIRGLVAEDGDLRSEGSEEDARTFQPIPRRAAAALRRTKDHLKKLERDLERFAQGLSRDHHLLAQAASPLEEEVMRLRMLPFAEACEGLERAVRDVAKTGGKEIELRLEGTRVELDRAILERLRGPLLHLVRNAADHGIERADERSRKGKPARGRIQVSAALRGSGGVEIVVSDDGRGLNLNAILEQARRRGYAIPEQERDQLRLIFQPGFSTASFITEVSGRGIGLDVVRHEVEALHGAVDVSFEPARGTRFSLALPLTLTTLRALMVEAGGQTFAMPSNHVRRLVRAGADEIATVEGREVLLGSGSPVPVVSLAETLGIQESGSTRSTGKLPLLVIGVGRQEVAFAVDELLDDQDVVVKSLGRRLRKVRHFSGATALPTGRLALILAPNELVQTAISRPPGRWRAAGAEKIIEAPRRRLLVVDDSVTTRSLEKSILEAAGYEVFAAADGAEAWQLLQERGADLVVTDVEMPRMDGFELTEQIRASKRFRSLPVILVTALETEQDKLHGLEVGADAYLQKSTFDQKELLEVITRLL